MLDQSDHQPWAFPSSRPNLSKSNMKKPIDIPIVSVGPGSQSLEDDELQYMNMPKEMFTHTSIPLPEPEEITVRVRVRDLLEDLYATVRVYRVGQEAFSHDLTSLPTDDLAYVNQLLGEGEVSVTLEQEGSSLLAQESVLTGIWRVRRLDSRQKVLEDRLEVADIPHSVRTGSFVVDKGIVLDEHPPVDGIQNSPALLVEIASKTEEWQPGMEPHVINLTLLPLTREDLIHLGTQLGVGPSTILSRGYGNCRIGSTRKNNVWWVKYFNSQDALILNTIEIVDIPAVALAAQEDIDDSAERLLEILSIYQ